jgi:hypothetical protein
MTDQLTENLTSDPAQHRSARPAPKPKPKTKMLSKLLVCRTGAIIVQIQRQPHTIRAAILRLWSSGVPAELDRSCRVARYRILPVERQ